MSQLSLPHSKRFPLICALLGSTIASLLTAQEDISERSLYDLSLSELLEVRIVTSASGYEQNPADAPASIAVIESEEWKAMGSRTVFEAINHLPSVHVAPKLSGINNNKAIVRGLSGANGQQVLLLIDGESFSRIQTGGTFLGHRLPLVGFKRVEVINNPGSAVYGADAFGGIIQAISYDEGEMPTEATFRAGSFGTYESMLSHAIDLGNSTLQFAFEYHVTDDDDSKVINQDLQSTFDSIFGSNASNAPGVVDNSNETYTLNAAWFWKNLKFRVFSWESHKAGLGTGIAQALDPGGWSTHSSTTYDLDLDLSELVPVGSLEFSLGHHDIETKVDFTIFPAGAILPIGPDGNIDFANSVNLVTFTEGYRGIPNGEYNKNFLRLTHTFDSLPAHKIRWQIGYEDSWITATEEKNFGPSVIDGSQLIVDGTLTDVTGTPYIYLPDEDRTLYYASLQDEWTLNDSIHASVGLRYDDYSDFGSTTNYRLGLVWHLSEKTTLKAFSGTAYRAPGFTELFARNNPAATGNENLSPETLRTLETGLNFNYLISENFSSSIRVFNYSAKDLIQFVPAPISGVQEAQNIGRQDGTGFEFMTQWKANKQLSISANYSYLDSEDKDNNNTPDIPTRMANLGINWRPYENWNIYIGNKWVAARYRKQDDDRPAIKDYNWGKLSIARSFDQLDFRLTINNLFDVDAREPSNDSIPEDFPLQSQSYITEIIYKF